MTVDSPNNSWNIEHEHHQSNITQVWVSLKIRYAPDVWQVYWRKLWSCQMGDHQQEPLDLTTMRNLQGFGSADDTQECKKCWPTRTHFGYTSRLTRFWFSPGASGQTWMWGILPLSSGAFPPLKALGWVSWHCMGETDGGESQQYTSRSRSQ